MKRWLPGLIIVLGLAVAVFFSASSNPDLLKDTDTKVLLETIRERKDPMSWLTGDWPLANHFYRPVSTWVFELDNAVYGDSVAGYARTNALLAALCVVLLFWFLRELFDQPWAAGVGTALFAMWHLGWGTGAAIYGLLWWAAGLVWLGALRGGRAKLMPCLRASLALIFLSYVLQPPNDFRGLIVDWIPGRTASSMLVFVLIAMAAYARFERLTAGKAPLPPATPFDIPSTKGTVVSKVSRWEPPLLIIVTVLAVALALGAYEQAVMLPAALFGIAVIYRTKGRYPHWWTQGLFWGVLISYLGVRYAVVPSDASAYQLQQFRTGSAVVRDLVAVPLPLIHWWRDVGLALQTGVLILLTSPIWIGMALGIANINFYRETWLDKPFRWLILGGLALTFVSYLPMAFLRYFAHYWYWPSAMWTIVAVGFVAVTWKLVVSAIAPLPIPAPARSRPAAGSLPRP